MDKFLVDESSGIRVAELLRTAGYEILAVAEEIQGATDEAYLQERLEKTE